VVQEQPRPGDRPRHERPARARSARRRDRRPRARPWACRARAPASPVGRAPRTGRALGPSLAPPASLNLGGAWIAYLDLFGPSPPHLREALDAGGHPGRGRRRRGRGRRRGPRRHGRVARRHGPPGHAGRAGSGQPRVLRRHARRGARPRTAGRGASGHRPPGERHRRPRRLHVLGLLAVDRLRPRRHRRARRRDGRRARGAERPSQDRLVARPPMEALPARGGAGAARRVPALP
jgi:hypothetical protein